MLYRFYIISIGVFHCQRSLNFRTHLLRTIIVLSLQHIQYFWVEQRNCVPSQSLSLLLSTTPSWLEREWILCQFFNADVSYHRMIIVVVVRIHNASLNLLWRFFNGHVQENLPYYNSVTATNVGIIGLLLFELLGTPHTSQIRSFHSHWPHLINLLPVRQKFPAPVIIPSRTVVQVAPVQWHHMRLSLSFSGNDVWAYLSIYEHK